VHPQPPTEGARQAAPRRSTALGGALSQVETAQCGVSRRCFRAGRAPVEGDSNHERYMITRTPTDEERIIALARHRTDASADAMHLFCAGAARASWHLYGLPVYGVEGEEWAVGDEAEAEAAARAYVGDLLWTLDARFLVCYAPPGLTADDLLALARGRGDEANSALQALARAAGRYEALLDDILRRDGRGHYLAALDGAEVALADGWLGYRIS
jgi:hypothetical protein